VTTDIATHCAAWKHRTAIARALTNQLERGGKPARGSLSLCVRAVRSGRAAGLRVVWRAAVADCAGPDGAPAFSFPEFVTEDFADVSGQGHTLSARGDGCKWRTRFAARGDQRTLDKNLMEQIAKDLGKITFSPNAQDQSLFAAGSQRQLT